MSRDLGSSLAIAGLLTILLAAPVLGDGASALSTSSDALDSDGSRRSGGLPRGCQGTADRGVTRIQQCLRAAQPRVDAVAGEELGVGADLGEAPFVHQADCAGPLDGRQPVGNDQSRAVAGEA